MTPAIAASSLIETRSNSRFRIIRELGSGGMGTVYEAFDRERRDLVALKTLQSASAPALARLKREFRSLVDLGHPNIARLGELFEYEGVWYFTMELVRGTSFLRYVRREFAPGAPPRVSPIDQDAPTAVNPHQSAAVRDVAPAPAGFHETRLRQTLSQLAQGLVALHRLGKVHRDVKSSNVVVTRQGRVVVVDFGTVVDFKELDEEVIGTPSHMAPEQAAGKPASAAADWYGVGVLLYEALTGRRPFLGTSLEILEQKQILEPLPPRLLARGVPDDLDQLCTDLLARDPQARITGGDVLCRLRAKETPSLRAALPTGAVFVGRRKELHTLHEALAETQAGKAVVVVVEGKSGVGKSALVRQFCEEVRSEHPDLVLLEGRCHERESVPYRALDGIIDALSRFLAGLPKDEAAALLPARAAVLARVFPVLELVESVSESKLPPHDEMDPQELRFQAFRSLRELFTRLVARRRVLLTIDDLQWADIDSLAMLAELFRAGGCPLLLVATLRLGGDAAAKQTIESHFHAIEPRTLPLAELRSEDAVALATLLCEHSEAPPDIDVNRIAAEAEGNPFFIGELVRLGRSSRVESSPASLSDVLWTRIQRIQPAARRVLEVLAIAGSPVAQAAVATAVSTDYATFSDLTAMLRAGNLLRAQGVRGSDLTELYHDRIREAILSRMDDNRRRMWHRRLAVGLERSGVTDPEALALHWIEGGDGARGADYAALAARQAGETLAFNRAARLYQLALSLTPSDAARRRVLLEALANSLANAGNGAQAAAAYLEAAALSSATAAIDLRRRAAEQLLRCGHVDDGLLTADAVLRAVGMRLPRAPLAALSSLLVRRGMLRLRGLGYAEREERAVSPAELTRIDVCWSMAIGLGIIDTVRGADFQTRHLLLALKAGEPYRVARALAIEVGYAAASGPGKRRAHELEDKSIALAKQIGNAHALGLAIGSAGTAAFLRGRWRLSRQRCEEAAIILRDHCSGVAWELDGCRLFGLAAAIHMGALDDALDRGPSLVNEAQQRGDLFAATNLRVRILSLLHIVRGRPDLARSEARDAMSSWSLRGFHVEHFFLLFAETFADLYARNAESAYRRIHDQWPLMKASLIFHVNLVHGEALYLRALASLMLAGQAPQRRGELVREAKRCAALLHRSKQPWGQAAAAGIGAGIARLTGHLEHAVVQLRSAGEGFEANDMSMHAAAARFVRGELICGAEGGALTEAARSAMAAQHVADPASYAHMLIPVSAFARPGDSV